MNIFYVITTSGNDYFSLMTRISIATVRVTNPEIRINIAVDNESKLALEKKKDALLGEINNLYSFDVPEGSDTFKNRYIKTQLRNLINGPYLFLDSDTVVKANISELFQLSCDVAGSFNHSKLDKRKQIWDKDQDVLNTMFWQVREDAYINGGVMFFNDNKASREFAKRWFGNWLKSYQRIGNYRDQPALNFSLNYPELNLHILPSIYNAQIMTSPSSAVNAKIIHYYSSVKNVPITSFDKILKKSLILHKLNPHWIDKLVKEKLPWINENFVDTIIAKKIIGNDSITRSQINWLTRNYRALLSGVIP